MEVVTRIDKHHYIIKLLHEFKEEDCTGLRHALESGCNSFCQQVILDCSQLKNITSSGQRVLLSYLSKLQALKMLMILCTENKEIIEALKNSGLVNLVPLTANLEEAKALTRK